MMYLETFTVTATKPNGEKREFSCFEPSIRKFNQTKKNLIKLGYLEVTYKVVKEVLH